LTDKKVLKPKKLNRRREIMISDSDVFVALFVALLTGILAVRLGVALYS
jgi:photosystem I reaction center subunit XII